MLGVSSIWIASTRRVLRSMYFPDLAIYPNVLGTANLRAIGWLDTEHEFVRGDMPASAMNTLREILLSNRDVNRMRGYHICGFCARDLFGDKYLPTSQADFRNYVSKATIYLEHQGKKILLGMSEIWIPSSSGIIYASPSLIYHYMEVHRYLPPQEFLDAAAAFDLDSAWNGEAEVEKWLVRSH